MRDNATIKLANSDIDIARCFPVMKILRPHLLEDEFLHKVKEMIRTGYNLAYIEEDNRVVSAVGFREFQMLYNGNQIYIDDLITHEDCRGKGYGSQLLEYVFNLAREKNCDCVTLDSGPARHAAHRLYLNNGFIISSYHFMKTLK